MADSSDTPSTQVHSFMSSYNFANKAGAVTLFDGKLGIKMVGDKAQFISIEKHMHRAKEKADRLPTSEMKDEPSSTTATDSYANQGRLKAKLTATLKDNVSVAL